MTLIPNIIKSSDHTKENTQTEVKWPFCRTLLLIVSSVGSTTYNWFPVSCLEPSRSLHCFLLHFYSMLRSIGKSDHNQADSKEQLDSLKLIRRIVRPWARTQWASTQHSFFHTTSTTVNWGQVYWAARLCWGSDILTTHLWGIYFRLTLAWSQGVDTTSSCAMFSS